jgi:hypothetical protein
MKSSSTQQLEFTYSAGSTGGASPLSNFISPGSQAERQSSTAHFNVPDFSAHGEETQANAAAARMAGRINAASVSDEEHEVLLQERQALLDKKLSGTISRSESNRLEYVRWSLDRIDDAKYGGPLDALDDYVTRYERLLSDLQGLEEMLEKNLKNLRS